VGLLARMRRYFTQADEDRLADETRVWAESVPGTVRITACPSREQVRIAGLVSRLRLRPMDGAMTLEAVVSDGTGEVTAAWMGRSSIKGLSLGSRIILEGVMSPDRDHLRMVNPRFEFA
jgi:RecG-like helicase